MSSSNIRPVALSISSMFLHMVATVSASYILSGPWSTEMGSCFASESDEV